MTAEIDLSGHVKFTYLLVKGFLYFGNRYLLTIRNIL